MSLYEKWKDQIQNESNKQEYTEFVQKYYAMEEDAYKTILKNYPMNLSGVAKDIKQTLSFGNDDIIFMGFLDGINESIKTPLDLDSIELETEINLEIDYEKLFWNMHEAKADWLFNLNEWNSVLDQDTREAIAKKYRTSKIVHSEKIGRNDPCKCGSGKKYKNCCINK